MRPLALCLFLALSSFNPPAGAEGAELVVSLGNAPASGTLFFEIYDDPDLFGNFRDPSYRTEIPATGDGEYRLSGLEGGEIALLVYFDENANGVLDRNFIGIPREPIGLSNGYRPKGPPSFERASFRLPAAGSLAVEIEMYRLLGRRGQLGVGLGVIGQSSPYVESNRSVSQVIPSITYIGERLQWLGPELSYGFLGSDRARLAVTASYRIGAYEEDDSPRLEGLGDRDDTLMVGLGLEVDLPNGFELELGYEHDALDRIGGGSAAVELSRGFQIGITRLSPTLSVTWLSSDLGDHDFGVPAEAARPGRARYSPGSTTSVAIGVQTFVELSERWRVLLTVTGELLDSEIQDSPIVEDDTVISGFAAITYAF